MRPLHLQLAAALIVTLPSIAPTIAVAQQHDLNPTNDRDVQDGINRARLDYCARQREQGAYWDSLNWFQRQQADARIRQDCVRVLAVGTVRD
jgi:hypothetical protein